VLELKVALAIVVEMLPDERRTAIREALTKLAGGVDDLNALHQAHSLGEEQSHRLHMALRQIVEEIDRIRHRSAAP
jgi:hypothetical protein